MPKIDLGWRLRIRDAADTIDDIVITSYSGGVNGYIPESGIPHGDGQSIDPLDGNATVGSYTIGVIDAVTDHVTGARVITSKLADSQHRLQLLSRRAYIEETSDFGATFSMLVAGFVNHVRYIKQTLIVEFTIGESRRIEQARDIFQTAQGIFDKGSCLIGGPVRGGFERLKDYGAWTAFVDFKDAWGTTLRLAEGPIPTSKTTSFLNFIQAAHPDDPFVRIHGLQEQFRNDVNARAKQYRVITSALDLALTGTLRWMLPGFPDLVVRVEDRTTGDVYGLFTPVANLETDPYKNSPAYGGSGPTLIDLLQRIRIPWTGSSRPALATLVNVYIYPMTISETNPLHLYEHPVDLIADLWTDAGMAYNSAQISVVRALLGADLRVALRITKSWKLGDFLKMLYGAFGLGERTNDVGEKFLISTRIKGNGTPAFTIDDTNLYTLDPSPLEASEQSVVSQVTFKQQIFEFWHDASEGDRPIDSLLSYPKTASISNADLSVFGAKEVVYDIPGTVMHSKSWNSWGAYLPLPSSLVYRGGYAAGTTYVLNNAVNYGGVYYKALRTSTGQQPDTHVLDWLALTDVLTDFDFYAAGVAYEVFDRYGRGAGEGEFHVTRAVDAAVGDEVYVASPEMPNMSTNDRGGNRIVQIVKRTNVPEGREYKVIDSGSTAQPATLPVFTLAANPAQPRNSVQFVLTNAATIQSVDGTDAKVRVEIAFGSSTPTSGTLLTYLLGADAITGSPVGGTSPLVDSGSKVWLRMRTEDDGKRPSAYTAWQSVTLTALTAPASLTYVSIDGTSEAIAWNVVDSDVPIEIMLRLSTDAAFTSLAKLRAGSNLYTLQGLAPLTAYVVGVREIDNSPLAGVSTLTTLAFTTTNVGVLLAAPDNPSVFAGSNGPTSGTSGMLDGTYGLEVTARAFPSSVDFEIAVETSIGSAVAGTFSQVGSVQAVIGGRTRYSTIAPNDGLLRFLRARSSSPNATSSAYTPALSVKPWSITTPADYPVAIPSDITARPFVQGSANSSAPVVRVTYTPPIDSQFANMEYRVRTRPTAAGNAGAWGPTSVVVGGKNGSDNIPAAAGTDVEVIPTTVTNGVYGTVARNSGTALVINGLAWVVVPFLSSAMITVPAPTATAVALNFVGLGWGVNTSYAEVWTKETSTNPGATPSSVYKIGGLFSTIYPTQTSISVPVLVTTDYVVVTFIPYDQFGIPGTAVTVVSQGNASAVVPQTPSAASGAITGNSLTLAVTIGTDSPTYIRIWDNGAPVLIVSVTVGSAGTQNVVLTGLANSTTHPLQASVVKLGVDSVLSNTVSMTTSAAGSASAPVIGGATYDNISQGFDVYLSGTGNATPGAAFWVKVANTSGGTYSAVPAGSDPTNLFAFSSQTLFATRYLKAYWISADGTVTSPDSAAYGPVHVSPSPY